MSLMTHFSHSVLITGVFDFVQIYIISDSIHFFIWLFYEKFTRFFNNLWPLRSVTIAVPIVMQSPLFLTTNPFAATAAGRYMKF